ncbi:MAG: tryptophanase [Candidatus Eisenbacteria bacterium]|uniref:Tryptophanase n=1 Tax=Eiseniibacteriota bacterium TaxID=2212470 RepID=A0A938BPM4_UNCEI|nr:tryptophanase [Candidatus Eisenbacteria bacterium]
MAQGPGGYETIIEPFRIKSVEQLRMTTRAERERLLAAAGWNLFLVRAEDVLIDLLTDSGTSSMSAEQWAGIMRGDESYAGSRSFFAFEAEVRRITGFANVIPTHQGRAAEKILFNVLHRPGGVYLGNTHFDTTRANIEYLGDEAVDLPIPEGVVPARIHPFKGNIDLARLEADLARHGERVCGVILTVTNNSGGGQPVSMANIREASRLARAHGALFILDACRFAENAYFIQQREEGCAGRGILEIAQEMFSYADAATMSAKKDGLANIGGFLACHDDELAAQARNLLILTEGFPTYGGLAGRDLEAIAQGLREVLDPDYLRYRVRSVAYFCEKLQARGVPLILPPGGHAVFIDAGAFLDFLPREQFPGVVLANELYLAGGIRGVEIGTLMFGKRDPATGRTIHPPMELVRLAVPRRVYTQSHVDYAAEVILDVHARRRGLRGLRLVHEAPFLRHFTARLEPV